MAYASTSDMITRFSDDELTSITNPTGALGVGPDLELLQAVLNDAHADMDLALGKIYVFPLPVTCTPLLKPRVLDLAMYSLLTLRRSSDMKDLAARVKAVWDWVNEPNPLGSMATPISIYAQTYNETALVFTDSVMSGFTAEPW